MIPITFWASLPPWVKLSAAEEISCRRLNHFSATDGLAFFEMCKMIMEMITEITIPITGASTIKATTFNIGARLMACITFTPREAALAIPAPAKPPIRVCEELEGIPNHQVKRFQVMAASKPARITSRVMKFSTTVLAMVLATL
ncbi:hypothetical protein D3C86_1413990 [compost metagenome]